MCIEILTMPNVLQACHNQISKEAEKWTNGGAWIMETVSATRPGVVVVSEVSDDWGTDGDLSRNKQTAVMGDLGTEASHCYLQGWGPFAGLNQQRFQVREGSHFEEWEVD